MSFTATQPMDAVPGQLQPFDWPTPPFAAYPRVQPTAGPLSCEIEGLGGKRNRVQLLSFDLQLEEVGVQVVGVKRPLMLKFSQLRRLTLEEPIHPEQTVSGDPHEALLAHRPEATFLVQMTVGDDVQGQTVGHVEVKQGLFLFPPQGQAGVTSRVFIPNHAYESFTVGARVGEILVERAHVTDVQVLQAVQSQNELRQQRLGDVLVSRQIITPEQLLEAIDMQRNLPVMRLGAALVALDMITETDLEDALRLQVEGKGLPLGELLVRKGLVTRENLRTALAHKMGYPMVDVLNFPLDVEALKAVPYAVASRLQVLPLLLRQGRLIVAMDDPTRRNLITELEFLTQYRVVPALPQVGTLADGLKQAYQKHGLEAESTRGTLRDGGEEVLTSGALLQSLERSAKDEDSEDERPLEQSDNSLVRLINTLIIDASLQGASDIHIECPPGREKIRIRFRRDGHLFLHMELPYTYRAAVVSRIKIMCDLDISERRRAQDGKIVFSRFSPQYKLELRVATIPTAQGLEDVVMRLLASSRPLPLEGIGLSPANYSRLRDAILRPYGMVLCVGPTGSGKTTTLHSALGHINRSETKIWTAEDPVEITQPGLRQVQVNPKIDWTFAKALRAFLRADPDVIMVGEIRDTETAHMAIEASLTGHLVLSTLHTNSAPETITRLLDMGMDPFNFADSLLAVLAQRLGRRLCAQCRTAGPATADLVDEWLQDYLHVIPEDLRLEPAALRADWVQRFGTEGRLLRYHSPGCKACDGTGHKGRLGFHELLTVSRELRRLVQRGARAEELQAQAIREGMRTLRQDGIEKVLQGLTSLDEVRMIANA
ncbi:MAG: ATPase, T2SS/T4P/T4SS family [Hydrogenophaga sp.]|uniref:GspE/PulE family protein n=1 Tax=Hydrogenophaga sp. TaxID=1904254 RepID=UPI002777203B|nr:ATPase, T2SS/T4P/T4SS family [Hydrogenophaga sp.]MDP2419620.1 ATPase, T2SS/T4P/T4SS family [Hydrogenophaga sp.]MDZ4187781.1 ATPase, T2SS/T4P/T4SS family [Hydrogenophaga sp.]